MEEDQRRRRGIAGREGERCGVEFGLISSLHSGNARCSVFRRVIAFSKFMESVWRAIVHVGEYFGVRGIVIIPKHTMDN